MNDDIQHTEIHAYEPLDETLLQKFKNRLLANRIRRRRPNTPDGTTTTKIIREPSVQPKRKD